MKLKDYTTFDLEQMTYSEITEIILNEKGTKMKIVDIFKKICEALSLDESVFEKKIADYFELVSTDSKFIVLDKGFCDLRKKHAPKMEIEEDEDDIEEIESDDLVEEDEVIATEENNDDIFYDSSSEEDDVDDGEDELDDFAIIDDEDEEANGLV